LEVGPTQGGFLKTNEVKQPKQQDSGSTLSVSFSVQGMGSTSSGNIVSDCYTTLMKLATLEETTKRLCLKGM